jgi:hypothetical protein
VLICNDVLSHVELDVGHDVLLDTIESVDHITESISTHSEICRNIFEWMPNHVNLLDQKALKRQGWLLSAQIKLDMLVDGAVVFRTFLSL